MKKPLIISLSAFVLVAVYASWLAWRARTDKVTLRVTNAEVGTVLKKLRWQTWEKFVWNKEITGTITLDVKDMPLDQVLEIMSNQAQFRWSKVYPIYKQKKSLEPLEKALRGEIKFSQTAFTNLQGRAGGMGGRPSGGGPGGGGPGGGLMGLDSTNQSGLVSLILSNKEISVAAMALSRAGRSQVVPENGISPKLNLELTEVPLEEAIDQVADQTHRSWTRLYALQTNQAGPGMMAFAARNGDAAAGERRGPRGGEASPEMRERLQERMEQLMETMPQEQRQQAELRQQERQAMQSLTPEQRQAVMSERMNNPELQQRVQQQAVSNIRNSTPEQRRDRYERMYQMRKARAATQTGR